MRNIWKDGVLGVVIGDALGCPVQFERREEVAAHPVTGMRGFGTFDLPPGSWTDDSSLTLALLDSIKEKNGIDLDHIMGNFVSWLDKGAFTPYGYAYDIGQGTLRAIEHYKKHHDPRKCGGIEEWNNGNGSLMRILPACLYAWGKQLPEEEPGSLVHGVGSLTHRHLRANIACGLYYFMVKAVLEGNGPLPDRLRTGLDRGFAYYEQALPDRRELEYYRRLRDPAGFAALPAEEIQSSGYVVDALEAAVWALLNADTFAGALLKAVNLGDDTDTVGAIAGGLAGLYYGYEAIPAPWLEALRKREWIEEMCGEANEKIQG